jgi:hypothetical protein
VVCLAEKAFFAGGGDPIAETSLIARAPGKSWRNPGSFFGCFFYGRVDQHWKKLYTMLNVYDM